MKSERERERKEEKRCLKTCTNEFSRVCLFRRAKCKCSIACYNIFFAIFRVVTLRAAIQLNSRKK